MRVALFLSVFIMVLIYGCKKETVCSKPQPEAVSRSSKEDWRTGKLPVHWIWKAKYIDNFLPDTLVDYMGKNKIGC